MAGLQQFEHFIKQAALWHLCQQGPGLHQRCGGFGLQLETQPIELGGKTYRPDDAHRVFPVTCRRVTNHADHQVFGVLDAMVVIHHDLGLGVVIHGVDGEVTSHRVFFLRAPDVVAQHPARGVHGMGHACQLALAGFFIACHLLSGDIVQIGPKGGHLDHFMLAAATVHHMHDPKTPPDDEGAPKQALDLFGRGVGGHVKVFGRQTEHQVTHGTAHNVGLKSRLFECAHHACRPLVHQFGVDAMLGRANLHAFAKGVFRGRGRFAK